jgi:hypothetical protein
MQNPINSVVLFAILCASSILGFVVHFRLPERHRSPQSMALVQLAISLLVTFTAIVLGLLTTSVKQGFDAAYNARGEYAAQLAQMDRCLKDYGTETAPIRAQLRSYAAAVIASTWPDEPPPNPMVVTVVALCALSITVVVFVILDMDEPYGGLFGVPSASMRNALADMMR